MKSWEETYLAWLSEEPFAGARTASRGGRADQPAFRRCAWQHALRVFVLAPEYNFRINSPVTLVDDVRVIHGRHPDYHALARAVNYKRGRRTWPRRPRYARILRRARTATPFLSSEPRPRWKSKPQPRWNVDERDRSWDSGTA